MPKHRKLDRLEKDHVYTIDEACVVIGCGKPAIRQAVLEHGLPLYDRVAPKLVMGGDLQAAMRALEWKPEPKPHHMYCFRCKRGRIPDPEGMTFVDMSASLDRAVAPCGACGTVMNRTCAKGGGPRFKRLMESAIKKAGVDWRREDDASDRARLAPPVRYPSRAEANVRLRRAYWKHLTGGLGLAKATAKMRIVALEEFEAFTSYRDFKRFCSRDAEAFREHLRTKRSARTGEPLSASFLTQKLGSLHQFFAWLSQQQGYRRRLQPGTYEQFNPSRYEKALAKVRDQRPAPTPEEVEDALRAMPSGTEIEKRDRALVAFLALTGIRVQAVIGLKLKHVCLPNRTVRQDPREVHTKFGRDLLTSFYPIGGQAETIFADYVIWLRGEMGFRPDAPLFPRSCRVMGTRFSFAYDGSEPRHWKSKQAPQRIVRLAFTNLGFPNYGPHAFRHMLTALGLQLCDGHEEMKAWSQNLGHKRVRTTLDSYGEVPAARQAKILGEMRGRGDEGQFQAGA